MDYLKKYYPFWLGLYVCIVLIGWSAQHGLWAFSVIGAFLVGYFKLTKFH